MNNEKNKNYKQLYLPFTEEYKYSNFLKESFRNKEKIRKLNKHDRRTNEKDETYNKEVQELCRAIDNLQKPL